MTAAQILSQYQDIINNYAGQYGVDPTLVAAVIQTESSGNPNAFVAEANYPPGSYGLMQVLYTTAQGLGYQGDPNGLFDPDTNINYGTMLLQQITASVGSDLTNQTTLSEIYSQYNSGSPTRYLSSSQVQTDLSHFLTAFSSLTGQAVQAVTSAASDVEAAVTNNPGSSIGMGIILVIGIVLYYTLKG